jgi:hypothetical protein
MQSDHYFHADLGCLCPTPRLRRELRVACWAGLFGLAVGATSVLALSRDRAADPEFPAAPAAMQPGATDAAPRLASSDQNHKPSPIQAPEVQDSPRQPHELGPVGAAKLRSHTNRSDNGPEIARITLGRPTPLPWATPSGEPEGARAATPQAPSAPAPTASGARPIQAAPPDLARTEPLIQPKPRRITRTHTRPHKQPADEIRLSERAYARETAFPHFIFWTWAR